MPDNKVAKNNPLLAQLLLRAARLPLIYFVLGFLLTTSSYIDELLAVTNYESVFSIADKLGNFFFAMAIATFIYNFVILACRKYEEKKSSSHKVSTHIASVFRKGLRIIYFLVVINIIITLIEPSQVYLNAANSIIKTTIIASIGWIAIQILYTAETVLQHKMLGHTHLDHSRAKTLYTKMHVFRNIATVLIIIITTAAILMSFSGVRNLGISLLASAGFLTAIIGLSAQKTLYSLFSGLQIILSQAMKIGDIVVVEKESGIIEEITFTYVTLKLGDRRRMLVPITYFIEKPFENWSHEGDSLRSSLHIYLDYLMPIEPLRNELDLILSKSPHWDGKAQKLQVSNMTDRSVEIRIQVSAADADHLSDLRADVREKMLEFIRKNYPGHFPKVRLNGGSA